MVPEAWPARQKCPAGHRLEHTAFVAAPVRLLHVPAGQFVGAAELTGQKEPAGQVPVIHPLTGGLGWMPVPEVASQNEPAGQAQQYAQ